MKCDKKTMLLYAVTDRAWVGRQSLYEQVECALKGGATCVQVREKKLGDEDFLEEAKQIAALCKRYGVPLFIQKLLPGERIVLVNEVRFDGGVVRVFRGDMLERCHTVHPELSRR
mgnify:CR=1 FL=1